MLALFFEKKCWNWNLTCRKCYINNPNIATSRSPNNRTHQKLINHPFDSVKLIQIIDIFKKTIVAPNEYR